MKFKRRFIGILCVLSIILLAGCGANNTDTQSNKQYEYFDVVEMIENGDYDDAKVRIDEVYKTTDYSSVKGFNKAILMKLYYEKQKKYDEAIDEMLKAYNDGNYAKKIADGIEGTDEEIPARTIMQSINELLENVSEEKKSEVLTKIDKDIISKYANKE